LAAQYSALPLKRDGRVDAVDDLLDVDLLVLPQEP
jgi:hypothetical protein